MGKIAWIGVVLVASGVAAIAWGLSGSPASFPALSIPALSIPAFARAASSSLGLIAALFGIIFLILGPHADVRTFAWGRGAALFLALSMAVYLALQGPELMAVVLHRDRAWSSGVHDAIILSLPGVMFVWQIRDWASHAGRVSSFRPERPIDSE